MQELSNSCLISQCKGGHSQLIVTPLCLDDHAKPSVPVVTKYSYDKGTKRTVPLVVEGPAVDISEIHEH